MSGWRDVEGRTASERKQHQRKADRAAFIDTAQRRPLTLLKGVVGFALILVLCLAVVFWMR
jgi:hypothetical protein